MSRGDEHSPNDRGAVRGAVRRRPCPLAAGLEKTGSATDNFPLNPYGQNQNEDAMNRYGTQAMNHWQRTNPKRYATIQDPETFFTQLGAEAEAEIHQRATAIAGTDPAGENTYRRSAGSTRRGSQPRAK